MINILKDFIRFVVFHRWNKIDESHLKFAELSGFNPKGLHLKIYNYIKKINNITPPTNENIIKKFGL